MVPPSDSINHHSLKLAEFLSCQRNQPTMAAPPPPYAARLDGLASEELLGQIDDVDDDACNLAPIVIKIDTSIHVEGHANTVAIPAGMAATPEDGQVSPATENAPPTPTTPNLPQVQAQRQTKSAQLATAIIAALRPSGALEDPETGKQRPIEVNVNAGIRIKGNGNVVCAGVRRPSTAAPSSSSSNALNRRKRRALSEPLEEPGCKRLSR